MIGSTLAHYEITGTLGKGGMGEVWRARDTKLDREVAIKTLPSEFADDEERLGRFEREAKLLAALNHAHIGTIYGLDEDQGVRFLAMELVEGQTIDERLKDGPLPVDEALRLGLQIAEALEAAHDKGVVHRDLKPANIMVTNEGSIKVLDFGLAKAFSGDPNQASPAHSPALSLAATQQGIILGTAGYMSPEQASGQATDQRADVWAFGVVLFEMLSGLPLFTGESVPHILAGILRTDPEWDRLPKDLDPRIRTLLERCLEKLTRNRYHGIADARVDIEKILSDPDGAVAQPINQANVSQGRKLPMLATALATAIVAAVAAWYLKPSPVQEVPPVVRFDFALNAGQSLRAQFRDTVAVSPDGTQIAYNTNDGLYLRTVGELVGRPIPGLEDLITSPIFSPDGQWIGFFDAASNQLKKIRTIGGSAVVLTAAANPYGAAWNPDGSTILYGSPLGILEVSANGGAPTTVVEINTAEELWNPRFLPGNDSILFSSSDGGSQIAIQSRESDDRQILFAGFQAEYVRSGHLVVDDPAAVPSALFARSFNLETGAVGGPVPVAESVLFSGNKTHFSISDNGTLVYVHGDPSFGAGLGIGVAPELNITLVNRDGARQSVGAPARPYRSPRLSPDATQVAVEIIGSDQRSSIWVYDLAGESDIRRLTQVSEGDNRRPVWTPDGERLAFSSDRDGTSGIYWQAADGSSPAERLTTADQGLTHLPESWSPDGVLSFAEISQNAADGWGIWTRDSQGDIEVFHSLDVGNQFGSVFSPDGQWIAYATGEGSNNQDGFRIYAERFPKTGERHELAGNGATWPVWSQDGAELFYRRGFTQDTRLLNSVAILETEPSFRFSTTDSVAIRGFTTHPNYRDFDPFPDSSGWIMLTDPQEQESITADAPANEPQRINVVLNWFEELNERVPTE